MRHPNYRACPCYLCSGALRRGPIIKFDLDLKPAPPKLPEGYTSHDISDEAWREIHFMSADASAGRGLVYRIENPVTLIIRKGGSTHRVIDAKGEVHCYVAPESGKTVIRWGNRPGKAAVRF
jgi:hypothetical protein